MNAIEILEKKNKCLRRLLEESTPFIASLPSDTHQPGEAPLYQSLGGFLRRREMIVRIMGAYDRKLANILKSSPKDFPENTLERLNILLETKNILINEISKADRVIIEALELEQARVRNEINHSRKAVDNLQKFKSAWIPESGEGLDQTL